MAKKKLTEKQKKKLAEKLKKSKVKENILPKLKKEKDSKFVKEVEKDTNLIPTSDLNTEIRLHTRKTKRKKGEIQSQKNRIKALEKENKIIVNKRKALEEEFVFADEKRKAEIKLLLAKPDYKKKDLFQDKNLLKYMEGKDFDYVINDGFKKYRLNTKDLKKYWKKGQDATLPILKKMEKDSKEAIKHFDNLIKKEKKTASKARMKKLRRIRDGLKNKLEHTIQKNIEAVETGNSKVLDEFNEEGEKAYSLLFEVVGFSINRVGI